jgi:hypothetical protein
MVRDPITAPSWRRAGAAGGLIAVLAGGCYDGATAKDSEQDAGTTAGSEAGEGGTGGPEGTAGEGTGEDGGLPPPPPFEPGKPVLPRLTTKQYHNTILELFGPGMPAPGLEADTNPYLFFTIGAASDDGVGGGDGAVRAGGGRDHARGVRRPGAARGADRVRADGAGRRVRRWVPGDVRAPDLSPAADAEEQGRWLAVATELAEGDAWRGVQLMVAGMLQSPHFLYRVELGVVDPGDPQRRRYTGWEMASRMSFLLWDRAPDDALLLAAEQGLLDDRGRADGEAERLLADPRADAAMSDFFAQFLDLGRLDGVTRDPARYPLFTPTMIASMRTEVQLRVEDLVNRRDADVRRLFSSRETFVNTDLAALYGIVAEGATPVTFVPATLPEDGPRAGILTSGAFLTMNAHETATSPTARGKYVRERVLCEPVPPPPDDIDTEPR